MGQIIILNLEPYHTFVYYVAGQFIAYYSIYRESVYHAE